MPVRSWIRNRFAHTPRTVRNAPARYKPALEPLEGRDVPASLNFYPTHFAVGQSPTEVAVGDFNRDGRPDLATANADTDNVSVLLGTGTGSFQPAAHFAAGDRPSAVAVGDFNGDGKPDLAAANIWSHNVSLLLGTGTGTFQPVAQFPVGERPGSMAVGDFNGDGRDDLAVTHDWINNISVLRGTSTGSFLPPLNFAAGFAFESVAVGDFNGDGRDDLVTTDPSENEVGVILGTGTGTFAPTAYFAAGDYSADVAVGDFNGDGKADLATANFDGNDVSVLLGTGTGSFQPPAHFPAAVKALSVAVGDFNGDGKADLATSNYNYHNPVSVLLGTGTGSFQPPAQFFTGESPECVAVGDFNGDGLPDLTTANYSDNNVSVLINNTAPTLTRSMSSVAANEGGLATTVGTFADAQGKGTVTLTASVGTVTKDDKWGSWNWSYTAPDNSSAPTSVTITATDPGGLTSTVTFPILIRNAAPQITSVTIPSTATEGVTVNLSAIATDVPGDPLAYTWTVTRPDGTLTTLAGAAASFVPPDNGNYGVILTVSDGEGGVAASGGGQHPDMAGWWQAESNAKDSLGVNNGSHTGYVYYSPGKVGYGFVVNGTSGVTVPDSPSLDATTAVTLEAWVRTAQFSFNNGFGAIIAKSSGTTRNYGLFARADGGLHLSYVNAAGVNVILDSPGGLLKSMQFAHVAATIDTASGVMRISVNGQVVASRATVGPMVANTVPLAIGLSDLGYNYGYIGTIDEAAVYDRALSQTEIQLLVTAGNLGVKSFAPVAVANVAPWPWMGGPTTGSVGQPLAFTVGASDPSADDRAAGFRYQINWGDGSGLQTIERTANNGSGVGVTHAFTRAGTIGVTVTVFDDDGGSYTSTTIVVYIS